MAKIKLTDAEFSALPVAVQALYVKADEGYKLDVDTTELATYAGDGVAAKNRELLAKMAEMKTAAESNQEKLAKHDRVMAQTSQALVTDRLQAFADKYALGNLKGIAAEKLAPFFELHDTGESFVGRMIAKGKDAEGAETITEFKDDAALWEHLKGDAQLSGLFRISLASGPSGATQDAPVSKGNGPAVRSVQDRALEIVKSLDD